ADIGGIVGKNDGNVNGVFDNGSVTANGTGAANIGAVAGLNAGSLIQSYAYGSVTIAGGGDGNGGGLVGQNSASGTIDKSYAVGKVTADGGFAYIGGLAGENLGSITESFAGGPVIGTATGNQYVGGLVGYDQGNISQAYSYGHVTGKGTSLVGGMIGYFSAGTLTSLYFDRQTSGAAAADGAGNVANVSGVTAMTTAQLQAALPGGFSGSDWKIIAGKTFPELQAFGTQFALSGTA